MTKNNKKFIVFIFNDDCLNVIVENNEVLVVGFGCKGYFVSDIFGIYFRVVNVVNVFFLVLGKGKKKRLRL